MDKKVILVADDDENIRELLNIILNNQDMEVVEAGDGLEALHILENRKVDLILLDVMMPNMDGIMACMKIREKLDLPIIILSAKSEDTDKILGLTIGADDYIGKPFNPMLLIAKIKSVMRRYDKLPQNELSSNIITIDDLTINLDTHEVRINDELIKLTPHEFDILLLLSKNRGKVLSIEQIYESIWKEPYIQFDRTVTVHIRRLRQKLTGDYIKTVWGVGYKIEI